MILYCCFMPRELSLSSRLDTKGCRRLCSITNRVMKSISMLSRKEQIELQTKFLELMQSELLNKVPDHYSKLDFARLDTVAFLLGKPMCLNTELTGVSVSHALSQEMIELDPKYESNQLSWSRVPLGPTSPMQELS